MSTRIRFLLPSRQTVIQEYVTMLSEQCQTTSTSSQKCPSRGYKSYTTIFPTKKHQECPKVIAANQGSGIKQQDSRGYQPRMLKGCSQPQELQQTTTTSGRKDPPVSSGEINKCSQNDITTSSNPDIKYTSSISQSNVICGSCGEKGHNRTRKSCPNYYTEKESARREAHAERRRQKIQELFLIIIRKENQPSILSLKQLKANNTSRFTAGIQAEEVHAVYQNNGRNIPTGFIY